MENRRTKTKKHDGEELPEADPDEPTKDQPGNSAVLVVQSRSCFFRLMGCITPLRTVQCSSFRRLSEEVSF